MKLLLVDNDGLVIDSIDDVEDYDLNKALARATLTLEVVDMVKRAGGYMVN